MKQLDLKPISYRQVLEALKELDDEQLDMSASILDADTNEVIPIYQTITVINLPEKEQEELLDVLDDNDNHPLLVINGVYD